MDDLQLGRKVDLPASPHAAIIDVVPNAYLSTQYSVRFLCPEFTSICPVTGQPDFGTIVVDYVPGKVLIESKALKLFLGSFRNHGAFHEACVAEIGRRLWDASTPYWMRVAGLFNMRGGISINPVWQLGSLGEGIYIPPLPVP